MTNREQYLIDLANKILDHLTSENYLTDHDLADVVYDGATELKLVQWDADKLVRI